MLRSKHAISSGAIDAINAISVIDAHDVVDRLSKREQLLQHLQHLQHRRRDYLSIAEFTSENRLSARACIRRAYAWVQVTEGIRVNAIGTQLKMRAFLPFPERRAACR